MVIHINCNVSMNGLRKYFLLKEFLSLYKIKVNISNRTLKKIFNMKQVADLTEKDHKSSCTQ